MDVDGKNARPLVRGFDAPDYDLSPDGKWIAYAHYDDDYIHIRAMNSSSGPWSSMGRSVSSIKRSAPRM